MKVKNGSGLVQVEAVYKNEKEWLTLETVLTQ